MSLNKITSAAVRKEWMNINCDEIECTTLTADTLAIDNLGVQKITIEGPINPQLVVGTTLPAGAASIRLKGGEEMEILFVDSGNNASGRILSAEIDNTFQIDPEERLEVQIQGPIQLKKQSIGVAVSPPATHLSLYADINNDIIAQTSGAVERPLAYYTSGSDSLNINLNSGGGGFNQPIPSRYAICGDHVSIWGVFRLNANDETVDVSLDSVPGYPVSSGSQSAMLNGQNSGAGGVSFIGIDTTYSAPSFQLLYGSVNNVTVVPANNFNTLFHYRIDYLA